ncbi:274_t:CDS:2, partial [Acaulospora colombiana]
NAAIDELAKRLREGVLRSDGVKMIPSVVRLGAENAINVSVKDISLDQLVTERLSKSSNSSTQAGTEVVGLRSELARVKELRQTKQAELQASQGNTQRLLQIEQELRELTSKRIELSTKLTAATDKSKDAARAVDSAKRKARLDILNEADIICCTLSGAGHDIIEQFEFDLIVIDEAAQAIELSSLIPLKFSSKRCIMQLPPTPIRETTENAATSSASFELEDGPDMAKKTMEPWHKVNTLGIYKFFNVQGTEEQADQGHSQYNTAEVNAAIQLYDRLHQECPKVNFNLRIGIISMYRAQLMKLRQAFSTR